MTRDEETAFLAPFFEQAKVGGILIVGEIKQALDVRLGRKVARASAYNLLHRHGWRKLAPDKRPPKTDVAVQDEWKKTPRPSRRNRRPVARRRPLPTDVSGRSAFRENLGYPALWVPQADPTALPGQVTQEYTYAAVSVSDGQRDSLVLPTSTATACRYSSTRWLHDIRMTGS